ncbi:MAG: PAS domain S-box protein [Pyrinomonadaceae bacterium]|nr:PAS domain S-box protein [Pyrinomonadaceae bacterium]
MKKQLNNLSAAAAFESTEANKMFSQIGFGATFFDSLPNEVLILNRKGDIFAANDSFCRNFGYDSSDLLKTNWRELVAARESETEMCLQQAFDHDTYRWRTSYRINKNPKGVFQIDFLHLEDEPEFIALFHKKQQKPGDGIPYRPRRAAEKKTLGSFEAPDEFYKKLIELAPCPVFIADADFNLKYSNSAASRFLGYQPGELVGKNVLDLKRSEEVARMLELQRSQSESESIQLRSEWEYRKKDGSWVWGEAFTGNLPGGLRTAFVTDITERKNAEARIKKSQEAYRLFIRQNGLEISHFELKPPIPLTDSIDQQIAKIFSDTSLAESSESKAKHYGYSSEDEVIGKPFAYFVQNKATAKEFLKKFVESGYQVDDFEIREFDAQRNEKFYLSSLIGIVEKGKLIRIWGTQRDITERKRAEKAYRVAEEQLRHSQKIEPIGRLAGGIAHDFNNFLAVIMLQVDMINRKLPENDPLRPRVNDIKTVTDNAAVMVKQLLAFGRKQTLQPQPLVLNDVVEEFIKIIRTLIGEDIEITLKLDQNLGVCFVDPNQMTQILMNLAVNARDAMHRGGKLSIETSNITIDENTFKHRAQPKGTYIELTVRDNGIGMSAKTKKHIFEPFFTTKEAGKGTGLGLATVYGIVKQSKGFIWVNSKLQEGTTFTLHFPRTDKGAKVVKPEKVKTIPPGTETILLVEDEEHIRKTSMEVLESLGYTIIDAKDGEQAIEVAKSYENEINLLLTDVVMPKMNGKELAKKLKDVHPELSVLFMSGYTDDIMSRHGVLEEDVHFLGKPFTPMTLAVKVREAIEAHESSGRDK